MEELINLLIKNDLSISTMESCTGGGIVNAITNVSDASKVISFSAVTYSNEAKIKMGVSKKIIDKYSVYSIEVAKEMARCISQYTESSYGIGVTGKLMKKDENNLFGDDNCVYYCVYDQKNDIYYADSLYVIHDKREDNKRQVINKILSKMLEIVKNNLR